MGANNNQVGGALVRVLQNRCFSVAFTDDRLRRKTSRLQCLRSSRNNRYALEAPPLNDRREVSRKKQNPFSQKLMEHGLLFENDI
jgi:hypothetical protein